MTTPRRVALSFAVALTGYALWTSGHAPVHLDTARDLLIARDCVDRHLCHFEGPTSSFAGLTQGGTWIHVLEAARRLGASVHVLEGVVWGLSAIATGLVTFYASGRAGLGGGLASGIVFTAIVSTMGGWPNLWNPSLLPLPSALFFLALDAYADRRSPIALLGASLAFGIVVDCHLAGLLLLPGVLAPLFFSAPRSLREVAVRTSCALAGPLLVAMSSRQSLIDNSHELSGHGGAVLGAALALGAATAILARRLAAHGTSSLVRDTAALYALMLVAGGLLFHHDVRPWYLAPLGPPVALGVARLLASPGVKYVGLALALFGARTVWRPARDALFSPRSSTPAWSLSDADRCARALAQRGWTLEDALRGLDAEDGVVVVSTISAFLPTGTPDPRRHLLLEKRQGGDGLPLDGGYTAVFLTPPALDLEHAKRCIDDDCAPLKATPSFGTTFEELAYPARWVREPPGPSDRAYTLTYVVPAAPNAPLFLEPDPIAHFALSRDGASAIIRTPIARGDSWRDLGWIPALSNAPTPR